MTIIYYNSLSSLADPDALPAEPVFAIVQRPDDVKVLPDNGTPSPLAHFDCVPNLAKKLEASSFSLLSLHIFILPFPNRSISSGS